MQEYIKHLFIRTPLEEPAQSLQSFLVARKKYKSPDLQEIKLENARIERAMKQIVTNSSNCIDIGCHLGSMLSKILKLAPNGHHIAFEPIPYKANWLRHKFPEVNIKQMALGDQIGEVIFYINHNRSGFSGLQLHKSGKDENIEQITVDCQKLDNILIPEQRIDFIKLDVEGGELAVLRGAQETLSRYHPILLFECTKAGLSLFGFTSEQIFEFLTKQQGYSILLIKDFLQNGESLTLEKFTKALQYPFQAFNFIAVPNQP